MEPKNTLEDFEKVKTFIMSIIALAFLVATCVLVDIYRSNAQSNNQHKIINEVNMVDENAASFLHYQQLNEEPGEPCRNEQQAPAWENRSR